MSAGTPADPKVTGDDLSVSPAAAKSGGKARASVHSKDRDMGSALRSVYQKTVDEKVPDEMLSLLGKLD